MRFVVAACVGIVLALPSGVFAEEFNAGFVQGIWFGSKTVFEGAPVRIYVALRNNTDHDLTGTVRFTDNEKRIGVSYVSALPGRLIEAWTDWTPGYGEHVIVATLSNTQLHPLGENAEIVEVVSAKSEITLFVDRDTDKDGVGNKEDTDDDGDGVSDTDEVARGTDPLVADKSTQNTSQNNSSSNSKDSDSQNQSRTEDASNESSPKQGLEKYVQNETAHNALSKVTDTVNNAKNSIDAYRAGREDPMLAYLNGDKSASSSGELLSVGMPTSTDGGLATITRSKIQNAQTGFFEKVVSGGKALLGWLYSFLLLLASVILGHPALMELALLLLILITCYRLARKFGKRPKSYD